MARAPHPLLVIGLDGATATLLDALAPRLPNLTRLRRRGRDGRALSTEPPATFPAWTSVLTGCDPQVHGVRDLFTRDGFHAPLRPAGGTDRLAPLLVEEIAQAGYSVACIGVPGLHPPPKTPGYWVSGFDSPGADRAVPTSVSPPALYRQLEALGHWRYATFNEQQVSLDDAVEALLTDLEVKRRIAMSLKRERDWDLFFVHLQASDTASHHLWPTWDRHSPRASAYPHTDALPRIYERLDSLVGELVDGHRGRVLVVSDHGFTGASDVVVHVNRVLAKLGWATFRAPNLGRKTLARALTLASERLPTRLSGRVIQALPGAVVGRLLSSARQSALDVSRSRAFSDELDYAPSIWFREPPGEQDRAHLTKALLSLRAPDSDAPVVRSLHWREGAGVGPTVYLVPAWIRGYRPCFLPSDGPGPAVRRMSSDEYRGGRGAGMSGVHHPDGVAIVAGDGIDTGPLNCTLSEVGASLPVLMGIGRFHAPGRAEPVLAQQSNVSFEWERVVPPVPHDHSRPKVSPAVAARLRALGYL